MARPLSKNAKHRREYVVMCVDPTFHFRKFFVRVGYKSLILKEFVQNYPDYDISIYVFSGNIISDFK